MVIRLECSNDSFLEILRLETILFITDNSHSHSTA